MSSSDVLVIGAGPSGSIAGALLVKHGYRVTVLEREVFPRFSIGESLLPQCMQFIEEAGLLDAVRACAFQRKDGAVFARAGRGSTFEFADQFTDNGWCNTFEVQRATFDDALVKAAKAQGAEVRFGEEIVRAEPQADHGYVVARDRAGVERRLRGALHPRRERLRPRAAAPARAGWPSAFPVRRSIFTHVADRIDGPDYDRNKILIAVHPEVQDVWYWLIPFSNGRSSIGVVARERFFDSAAGGSRARLQRLIARTRGSARCSATRCYDTPVRPDHGLCRRRSRMWGDGFALLGNAGEFLDPVFSSGVTIAMKSASLATAVLHANCAARRSTGIAISRRRSRRGVASFRAFVEAWYDGSLQDIIFSERQDDRIKRMICSILAGYAWDEANPYVARARPRVDALAAFCAS